MYILQILFTGIDFNLDLLRWYLNYLQRFHLLELHTKILFPTSHFGVHMQGFTLTHSTCNPTPVSDFAVFLLETGDQNTCSQNSSVSSLPMTITTHLN